MTQDHRPNRLTPWGTREATPARGRMLANRGCLHDAAGQFTGATFATTRWLACSLDGPARSINPPAGYSQLFALDEATLMAAGHRPCSSCRPEAFARWKATWMRAHGLAADRRLLVGEMDAALHRSRLNRTGRQRRHWARVGDLPDGTMASMPPIAQGGPWTAFLVWNGRIHPWAHEGYGAPVSAPASALVEVLTPIPTVAAFAAGYRPETAL